MSGERTYADARRRLIAGIDEQIAYCDSVRWTTPLLKLITRKLKRKLVRMRCAAERMSANPSFSELQAIADALLDEAMR